MNLECKNGVMDLGFRPGSSTAISSTAISSTTVSSTLGSSNPISSTNKYLDCKVRLASIHYFLYSAITVEGRSLRYGQASGLRYDQVCEDGLGRAKGKQASSSLPTLNARVAINSGPEDQGPGT